MSAVEAAVSQKSAPPAVTAPTAPGQQQQQQEGGEQGEESGAGVSQALEGVRGAFDEAEAFVEKVTLNILLHTCNWLHLTRMNL